MKTIAAAKFKERCLSILDHVDRDGIIITKRGKAVAKLIPVEQPLFGELIGSLKGKLKVKGDILSTERKWDAQSRHSHRNTLAHR